MIGPQIPPELLKRPSHDEDEDDTDDDFGPKPFSHGGGHDSKVSLERDQEKNEEQPKIYGPQIPTELLNRPPPPREGDGDGVDHTPSDRSRLKASSSSPMAGPTKRLIGPSIGPSYPPHYGLRIQDDDDDSDDDVGPKPLPTGMSSGITDGVREFMEKEERRRKQVEESTKPKALKREEWMLVPPTSSDLLGSLDTTKLKARQFAKSAAPARNLDSSLWTETPAERQQRIADEVSGKKRRAANSDDSANPEIDLETRKRQRMDEKIQKSVNEHTRQVRNTSLVDMHSKGSSGKNDGDGPPGIWDHERDMGIGGRLLDDGTRDKILKDARRLGDKFGTGKHGGFL